MHYLYSDYWDSLHGYDYSEKFSEAKKINTSDWDNCVEEVLATLNILILLKALDRQQPLHGLKTRMKLTLTWTWKKGIHLLLGPFFIFRSQNVTCLSIRNTILWIIHFLVLKNKPRASHLPGECVPLSYFPESLSYIFISGTTWYLDHHKLLK